jgi:hypothetical protein
MDKNFKRLFEMIGLVSKLKECFAKKCKNEFEESKKNKYMIEIEKLKDAFNSNKIDFITFANKKTSLEIKIIKEKQREELMKCQLKNCYDETRNMIKSSIETLTADDNKGTPLYVMASKYKKIFEKNNYELTQKVIDDLDIDSLKGKLNHMVNVAKVTKVAKATKVTKPVAKAKR